VYKLILTCGETDDFFLMEKLIQISPFGTVAFLFIILVYFL